MKLQDIDALIAKIEDDIRRLDAELSTAKAFRLVLVKHEHGKRVIDEPMHIQRVLNGSADRSAYGATGNAIKNAIIERCPQEFSLHDIEEALSDMQLSIPRPSISQCLSRWSGDKIQVKTPGTGRKPTIYTKEGHTLRKSLPRLI